MPMIVMQECSDLLWQIIETNVRYFDKQSASWQVLIYLQILFRKLGVVKMFLIELNWPKISIYMVFIYMTLYTILSTVAPVKIL